jgi:hypothetical protein
MLPTAARLLDAADWAAIDAAVRHFDDPLFGPNPSHGTPRSSATCGSK